MYATLDVNRNEKIFLAILWEVSDILLKVF